MADKELTSLTDAGTLGNADTGDKLYVTVGGNSRQVSIGPSLKAIAAGTAVTDTGHHLAILGDTGSHFAIRADTGSNFISRGDTGRVGALFGSVTVAQATADTGYVVYAESAAGQTVQRLKVGSILSTNTGGARIKTGDYTGDGTTSQAISIGFQPLYVKIWVQKTAQNQSYYVWETTNTILDDSATPVAFEIYLTTTSGVGYVQNDTIIAITATGFTVDDAASDREPNKNAEVYNYLALG